MVTVVDCPQAIVAVYRNTENGVKETRLRCPIWKWYGSAIDMLKQLVALSTGLGMDREKHPAASANGDVAYGFPVRKHFFDNVFVE